MENQTEIMTEAENENDSPMVEEATTIGMVLKYTRMKQKKSVEMVSEALCIRKIYITAIESDDHETISPIPYGVGFVRSYAAYLGLNPDRIVQLYKQQALPQNEKRVQTVVKTHTKKSIPTMRHIVFCLLGIILLYLISFATHFLFETKNDVAPIAEENAVIEVIPASEDVLPQTDQATEEKETTEQPVQATEEQKETDEKKAQDNSSQINVVSGNYVEEEPQEESLKKMVLKFKGESWMEVKDSNKVYISGVFEKGFEYTIPSEKGLILSVGKYFNVDMYVDGILTKVATPQKQTGIELDPILKH